MCVVKTYSLHGLKICLRSGLGLKNSSRWRRFAIHFFSSLGQPRANIHRPGAWLKYRSVRTENFPFTCARINCARFVSGKAVICFAPIWAGENPAQLWHLYVLLTQIEEAFKNLKGDLAVRPIFHRLQHRIEAHIFIAFLAFCLHATLRHKLRLRAPGLTPRSVLEQLSAIQMLDVHFPTTDGRWLIFCRYTSPNKVQKLLIGQLGLELPAQSPPRITSRRSLEPLLSQTHL